MDLMNFKTLWTNLVSPLHVHGSPRETGTEGSENQVIPLLQLVFPLVQAQRDGCRRGITVFLNIYHHLGSIQAHSLAGCLDDTQVCLMGHQPSDIFRREVIPFHDLNGHVCHVRHRVLEHGLPFLINIMFSCRYCFNRRRLQRSTRFHVQVYPSHAVRPKDMVDHTHVLVRRLEEDRGSSTPKIGQVAGRYNP